MTHGQLEAIQRQLTEMVGQPRLRRWQWVQRSSACGSGSCRSGTAEKNPRMARGYSRDHRPDCEQLVIALIVNREGFPFS